MCICIVARMQLTSLTEMTKWLVCIFIFKFSAVTADLEDTPKDILLRQILDDFSNFQDLPFRNISLPWNVRVRDLVNRLNISEVIIQLTRGGVGSNGPAPAIERLGIGPYSWNTECLRGVGGAGPATSFPQAIGISASFNPSILWKVANATGAEARAKYIYNNAHHIYGDHKGMSCFAPVVNIMRHPLWGRNQETYGEDPFLSAQMAQQFVSGLQGNRSPRYLQATATCKHFDAYAGPEDIPSSRFSFNAVVNQRDFELTFFPAFEGCLAGGARGFMCSYNSVNGIPACANKWLLTDVLRQRWGFPGYVVSDQGALQFAISFHHYFKDPVTAAAGILNSGVNLDLANGGVVPIFTHLTEALKAGLVNESFIRQQLEPLFETRMRLGEFDPSNLNPYTSYQVDDIVQSEAHRQISFEAALSSFVLLKSEAGFLPWTPGSPSIAGVVLVGPFGRNMSQLYGDYAADRSPEYETTIEDGLKTITTISAQLDGCVDGPVCKNYDAKKVNETVSTAKLIVLTIGTGQNVEAEGNDRVSLELPNRQAQLLTDVVQFAQPTAKILILIFSATPVNIGSAVASPKVKGIIWCGFPAQTAGKAVASALTPEGAAQLAGRLPFTWYANDSQVPVMTDYLMHNQTYRYLPRSVIPQFPFGYGLSVTQFQYKIQSISKMVPSTDLLRVAVMVTNIGALPGQDVTQVYIQWPSTEDMPQLQLVGFARTLILYPKATQIMEFLVTPKQRRVWRTNSLQTFTGQLTVFVGGQQPFQKVYVPSNVLQETVVIV